MIYIPSMPSTLAQVQDAAQQILSQLSRADLDKLTAEFTGLAADLRSDLASGDIHGAIVQARTTLQAAQDAIRDADLPGLTADLKRTSTALRDVVQGEDTKKLLASATQAAERFANAADKLPALITSLQATSRRTDNTVADLEQSLIPVLRDIQATAANLRDVTQALRASPAQTIFGSPPPRTTGPAR
jgi:ABC-type transporter Mla subunit MlaD